MNTYFGASTRPTPPELRRPRHISCFFIPARLQCQRAAPRQGLKARHVTAWGEARSEAPGNRHQPVLFRPEGAAQKRRAIQPRTPFHPTDTVPAVSRSSRKTGETLSGNPPVRGALRPPYSFYEFRFPVVAARSARIHVWAAVICT